MTFDHQSFFALRPCVVFFSNKENNRRLISDTELEVRRPATDINVMDKSYIIYTAISRASRRCKPGNKIIQRLDKTVFFPTLNVNMVKDEAEGDYEVEEEDRTVLTDEVIAKFWPFFVTIDFHWESYAIDMIQKARLGPALITLGPPLPDPKDDPNNPFRRENVGLAYRVYMPTEANAIILQADYEMTKNENDPTRR